MLVKHLVKNVFDVCEELGVDPNGLVVDINQDSVYLSESYMCIGRECENYKDVYETLKTMKGAGTLEPLHQSKCGKCKTCKCSK